MSLSDRIGVAAMVGSSFTFFHCSAKDFRRVSICLALKTFLRKFYYIVLEGRVETGVLQRLGVIVLYWLTVRFVEVGLKRFCRNLIPRCFVLGRYIGF